jgi:hypothetical protein
MTTPRLFTALLIGLFVLLLGSLSSANTQERITVRGEIVDLSCYMVVGSRGAAYRDCARFEVRRGGVAIGVVTDAGELLLLVNESADRDPYEALRRLAGDGAEVTGRKVERQGVVSLIVESTEGRYGRRASSCAN